MAHNHEVGGASPSPATSLLVTRIARMGTNSGPARLRENSWNSCLHFFSFLSRLTAHAVSWGGDAPGDVGAWDRRAGFLFGEVRGCGLIKTIEPTFLPVAGARVGVGLACLSIIHPGGVSCG